MMRNLWNFNEIAEFSYDIENDYKKTFEQEYFEDGNSPPPPYSEVDQLTKEVLKENSNLVNNDLIKTEKTTFKYNDVGEEFYITVPTKPNVDIGLIILSGKNFRPAWPTILDIKKNSLASEFTSLRIGDQIKELCGIPTESLSHRQVAALFRKATDQIQMTVRRGLEVSDRSFDWFRYPFSSVSQNYEDIALKNEPKKNANPKTKKATFTSFRCTQEKKPCKEKLILKELESMRKYSHDYTRSMTMPLNRKVMHLPRQRALSSASDDDLVAYKFNLMNMTSPMNEGKFIVNEVEKIEKEKTMMTSAFSSSTISSFSSTSTSATQENLISSHGSNNQHHWMDNVIRTPEDDVIEPESMSQSHFDNGTEIIKNICRSPVNTFRNTLRKRKDKKEQIEAEENPNEKSILHGGSSGNAFLVTVWIGDRKKLGLKIGGGSVSPYGDSTLNVLEIRKSGTASKVFKIGDEILEIDSMVTTGMNVYEANSMISKLEGNYVEFKIFRPTKK